WARELQEHPACITGPCDTCCSSRGSAGCGGCSTGPCVTSPPVSPRTFPKKTILGRVALLPPRKRRYFDRPWPGPVNHFGECHMVKATPAAVPPRKPRNAEVRGREYLTFEEVERLRRSALALGRYGERDAAMILLGFRHGLRVSELVGLR